ncbi:hypothetical protein KFK09_002310 [Dendrobium nobile]|uniref:Uncharacterized protein n=1 Tax=Dendrobium nobile TaxID=94219 RepID=A0A8T3CDF0_DENNO|nr:hypothetical protein KFK09_002310 [Dendrobium nobile]
MYVEVQYCDTCVQNVGGLPETNQNVSFGFGLQFLIFVLVSDKIMLKSKPNRALVLETKIYSIYLLLLTFPFSVAIIPLKPYCAIILETKIYSIYLLIFTFPLCFAIIFTHPY